MLNIYLIKNIYLKDNFIYFFFNLLVDIKVM